MPPDPNQPTAPVPPAPVQPETRWYDKFFRSAPLLRKVAGQDVTPTPVVAPAAGSTADDAKRNQDYADQQRAAKAAQQKGTK